MKKHLLTIFIACAFITFATQTSAVSPPPAQAKKGMVVTPHHIATDVGISVLRNGGNAVDAAVAIGYALAVVHPCCGNLGGGGFMLIRLANNKNIFINFREKAPIAARPDLFLDNAGNPVPGLSTDSYLSVATPGTVLGLEEAREKYGTMNRQQLISPAIKLAEAGFILGQDDVTLLKEKTADFAKQDNVAAIFLKDGKAPFEVGDRLVQKNLAQTLKQILRRGTDAFYRGKIATEVVRASNNQGGILTMQDFARYTVEERDPILCSYRGYTIIAAPPPSSGGVTLCQTLNILEAYPIAQFGFHSAQSVHYMVEALRFAYADRNTKLADPNFATVSLERLISKEYANEIRAKIPANQAIPSTALAGNDALREGENTAHYSVIDKHGNAVAVTYTINHYFGNKRIAGNTGFLLNNEMDDFTSKPGSPNRFGLVQGAANKIESEKRPLSSMSPTIVTKDNRIFMITGSPGGSRIITTVLANIVNIIDHKMNLQEAVNAPRIHHQWLPDLIEAEPYALSADTQQRLVEMGYTIVDRRHWGTLDAILVDPNTGIIYGANDDRRPGGAAKGY